MEVYNWIPVEFNVIGCEYSTDIDIIIQVSSIQTITDYRQKKLNLILDSIINDLIVLGYDLAKRELDINLVYLDPTNSYIIDALVGQPKLTQNIIYHTYSLHPQLHPPIISNFVQICGKDYVRLFSKIILDWTDKLLGKTRYKELRPMKAQVYNDIISRSEFSFQILSETNFVELYNSNNSIVKSIGMKLSQILLLFLGEIKYTKKIFHWK